MIDTKNLKQLLNFYWQAQKNWISRAASSRDQYILNKKYYKIILIDQNSPPQISPVLHPHHLIKFGVYYVNIRATPLVEISRLHTYLLIMLARVVEMF